MGITKVKKLTKTLFDRTLYFLCLCFYTNFRFTLLLKKYNEGFNCLFDLVCKNCCVNKINYHLKAKVAL